MTGRGRLTAPSSAAPVVLRRVGRTPVVGRSRPIADLARCVCIPFGEEKWVVASVPRVALASLADPGLTYISPSGNFPQGNDDRETVASSGRKARYISSPSGNFRGALTTLPGWF